MSLVAHRLSHALGPRPLFHDLSVEVQPGEALWVQGANGSGKTTLLRLLCGLAWPVAGEVLWQGAPVREQRAAFHAELLYCGHGAGVKNELSAVENVVCAAALSGRACSAAQANDALARMGLAPVADLPAKALSQGQRKRVALAQLMLPNPAALWVLDEPCAALDAHTMQHLQARLDRHLADDGLLVYTTHQPWTPQALRLRVLALCEDDASWQLH